MNEYIEILNNKPINHPISEEILLLAFGEIDSLKFSPFIRKDHSEILKEFDNTLFNHFKKILSEYITTDNGLTWEESFTIVDKTAEECLSITQQKLESLHYKRTFIIEQYTIELVDAIDSDKLLIQEYIDTLNSFEIIDPFTTIIPRPPRKDENGNWITISNSGATPNVIG